jgi:hypothetical protein
MPFRSVRDAPELESGATASGNGKRPGVARLNGSLNAVVQVSGARHEGM